MPPTSEFLAGSQIKQAQFKSRPRKIMNYHFESNNCRSPTAQRPDGNVFGIFLIKTRPMFVFCDGLVNREVHFPAFVNLAVFNFPTRISESCKHLILRVIDQDISVGKVKNLGSPVFSSPIPTHTPKLPADLERHCGFSRAGGHCKQDPFITL